MYEGTPLMIVADGRSRSNRNYCSTMMSQVVIVADGRSRSNRNAAANLSLTAIL